VAAQERATWNADVSMMVPGWSALLTSVVGPTNVSIDRSTLTESTVIDRHGVLWSVDPVGQSHTSAD